MLIVQQFPQFIMLTGAPQSHLEVGVLPKIHLKVALLMLQGPSVIVEAVAQLDQHGIRPMLTNAPVGV